MLVLVVLLVGLLAVTGTRAHGGGTPQLTNESIGPYWISVWTSPEPVREGQLHITIAVAEPGESGEQQAGGPILGAAVEVTLSPRSGGLADIQASATNEQAANRLFYEADVIVPAAGDWQVQIDVQGPEGSGQAHFTLTVQPAQENNWLLLGGGGFVLIAAFYFFYVARRNARD